MMWEDKGLHGGACCILLHYPGRERVNRLSDSQIPAEQLLRSYLILESSGLEGLARGGRHRRYGVNIIIDFLGLQFLDSRR